MKKYKKILIRSSVVDDGTLPRTGLLSDSPDVIPYGTESVIDPESFFIDNYEENVNKKLKATEKNYIYIRGKDLVTGVQKADMYVYYALDADLNDPSKWSKNTLKTSSGKSFYPVIGQAVDTILVAGEPFEWLVPDPADGQTYSLIGIVVASGTKPDFSGITDFEEFVADNNNVGWTKVSIEKPTPPPIPGLRWQTTFAYKQGDVEREISFQIVCSGIPVGSYVSFKADNASGPIPPIFLDKTKVTDPKGRYGIDSVVPASYESNVTFSFYCNGTPPKGSSVAFKAHYLEGKNPVVVSLTTTTN